MTEMMMMSKQLRSVLCSAALLLAACAITNATTLERMSLAKMSQTAPVIVRARCLENSTSWDAGEIWTFTSFEARQSWRGNVPARIMVRLLGGSVGNLTSIVSGIPRFQPGEEVILFLEPTPRGDFSVVSWQQGSFRIHRDVASGEESVTQDTASFATFDPVTRRFEMAGIRGLPVDSLRAQVNAALAAQRGRKQ